MEEKIGIEIEDDPDGCHALVSDVETGAILHITGSYENDSCAWNEAREWIEERNRRRRRIFNDLLPVELLATADSLRSCRWRIAALVRDEKLSKENFQVETILAHALAVSDSLEALARFLEALARQTIEKQGKGTNNGIKSAKTIRGLAL